MKKIKLNYECNFFNAVVCSQNIAMRDSENTIAQVKYYYQHEKNQNIIKTILLLDFKKNAKTYGLMNLIVDDITIEKIEFGFLIDIDGIVKTEIIPLEAHEDDEKYLNENDFDVDKMRVVFTINTKDDFDDENLNIILNDTFHF